MAKRYEVDMTQGPLAPMILKFALPLIASSVLQLLYNAADIVVVGKFAKDAVNAQGAVVNGQVVPCSRNGRKVLLDAFTMYLR